MSGDGRGGARRGGSQRAIPRPSVPPGPLGDLKALVYELYLAAGTPTLDEVAGWIREDGSLAGAPGRDTVRRVIGDPVMPASQADVVAVAAVLALGCRGRGSAGAGPVGGGADERRAGPGGRGAGCGR